MSKEREVFKLEKIEEAVTFRPNADEFNDPLEYINKIKPIAEKHGICKIVPPAYWKPPFCLDMNTFKFTPRVQRLNELEANTRIKLNFLEKLSKFWELQGKKFKIPILEKKPLDLYKLYKTVENMGGYEHLISSNLWSRLAKSLDSKEQNTGRILRIHYENILYPYLLFENGVTLPQSNVKMCAPAELVEVDSSPNKKNSPKKSSNANNNARANKNPEELKIENIRCLVCDRGDDEAFILLCDGCDDSYHTFCLYPPLKEIPKGDWRCPLCVAEICKKPTDAYGFEQSCKQYTLNEFGAMAKRFKSEYFKKPSHLVSSEEVEQEFWRILSSSDENVIVEYGADLHTLETGSGFPTKSNKGKYKENNEAYVDSPWNLNNLSTLDKSVLSQMSVEISGMKIPWAYVGMCFSCFCWHVEDHWSYSINYLHFGETKTWYGVSGDEADNFERVMKQNAKELFERSPDLLHHLVTIMDPNFLRKNGVPIYKVDQCAGEFVVTFPRAYHAGFNQGFNFAEAVNFCPADWLPIGRSAIESYKSVKRHSVFSHDELVCKIATKEMPLIDINTSLIVQKEIMSIIENERLKRKLLIDKGVKNSVNVAFEQYADDERTCDYCKTTCFVSSLRCSCSPGKMVCLDHYEHLCKRDGNGSAKMNSSKWHQLTILYRYTLEELKSILLNLKKQTDEFKKWCRDVEAILSDKYNLAKCLHDENDGDDDEIQEITVVKSAQKPPVSLLYKLVEQARTRKYSKLHVLVGARSNSMKTDKPPVTINLYEQLEKELNFAVECSKACKRFVDAHRQNVQKSMKQQQTSSSNDGSNDEEIIFIKTRSSAVKLKPSLEQLKQLAADLGKLVCDIDDKELFVRLVDEATDYERRMEALIKEWNLEKTADVKQILDYLNKTIIEFPFLAVENLKLIYKQSIWLERVNGSIVDPSKFSIKVMKNLIDDLVNEELLTTFGNNIKCNNNIQKTFVDLQELLSIAQTWDNKAKKLIDTKAKLSELEKLLDEAKCIPVYMENVEKLETIMQETNKWLGEFNAVNKDPNYPYLNDLNELLQKAQQLPVELSQLNTIEIKINLANEWLNKLDDLFLKPDSAQSQNQQSNGSTLMDECLIQMLTPRLDLQAQVNKLQSIIKSQTPPGSGARHSDKQPGTKRPRTKSLTNTSSSTLDVPLEIDSLADMYTEKNIFELGEKYKVLELKELDHMKQLRKLNADRLSMLINYLKNQNETSATNADQISTLNASSNQNVDSSTSNKENTAAAANSSSGMNNSNAANSKHNNLLLNVKCSACFKSLLASICSNEFSQCKLCLGLCHVNCSSEGVQLETNNKTDFTMCNRCERSKRPDLESIANALVLFERLDIRTYESNALKLFMNRALNWQESFKNTLQSSQKSDLKTLFGLVKTYMASKTDENLSTLKNHYESMLVLKKVELHDLYLEGLLMECTHGELDQLNQLFYALGRENRKNDLDELHSLVNKNSSLDFLELKLKTGKLNYKKKTPNDLKGGKLKLKKLKTDNGHDSSVLHDEQRKLNKKDIKKLQANTSRDNKQLTQPQTNGATSSKSEKALKNIKTESKMTVFKSLKMNSLKNKKKFHLNTNKNDANFKSNKHDSASNQKNTSKDKDSSKSRKRDFIEIEEEEFCASSKCIQPTGDNIKWVQCDGTGCNKWFHMICVGLTKIKKKEKYLCDSCNVKDTLNTSNTESSRKSSKMLKLDDSDQSKLKHNSSASCEQQLTGELETSAAHLNDKFDT